MRNYLPYILMSIASWGMYVPMVHAATGVLKSSLRAFVLVCAAYFLTGIVTVAVMLAKGMNPLQWDAKGSPLALFAGVLGAVGALGIVLAVLNGGKPYVVAPLVFSGAPLVATIVGMLLHPPKSAAEWPFYAGIVLVALGTGITMSFKPQ
ncbi:hypothetical protein A2881_01355 [Candidatus Peribacteria bacterium RIFCSPHIGHO2_01_FULL_55_13]|nr:MAG: hypothetical protein A2881_01355 [Candidatus Peribacteria bacterium RIFCSPHIGHO2_01_FULL_55_13]OGJ66610.1 MAG: hypothetical protein A3F36_00805 [Candidatus Peribacteria bacterium RIFCSPHIGHO2_12_FULL_55_11]